ncbi:MAG: ANTAR domain-containing protein [Firmicutes bacterium]|nr:ANTAR domain-containing protein [Bacillota bacterium]
MSQRRVVLGDSDDTSRNKIKVLIKQLGYFVVGEAGDGITALKLIRSREPELAVLDTSLPGMDGLQIAEIAWQDRLTPVVLLTPYIDPTVLEKARAARGAALLQKPVDENSLLPAMELARSNFEELCKLEGKIKELKETLETRKTVERAKGILMETLGLTEAEAFKRIQKQSMNKRVSMRAVADAVIMANNLK